MTDLIDRNAALIIIGEEEQILRDADKAIKEYAVITGRSEESLRQEAEEAFRIFKENNIDPIMEKESLYAKA